MTLITVMWLLFGYLMGLGCGYYLGYWDRPRRNPLGWE